MSKLSIAVERICGADKEKDNPYKEKYVRINKESLGTPIGQGRVEDWSRSHFNNPLE